jgi:hypothetical protein
MSDEVEAHPANAVRTTTSHITRIFEYSPKGPKVLFRN